MICYYCHELNNAFVIVIAVTTWRYDGVYRYAKILVEVGSSYLVKE